MVNITISSIKLDQFIYSLFNKSLLQGKRVGPDMSIFEKNPIRR